MDNLVLLIANLYNFKVVASNLIYDILDHHIEEFKEKDVSNENFLFQLFI